VIIGELLILRENKYMDIKQLTQRALEVRSKYSELEKERYGREWTRSEIMQGFVGDVGDLVVLSMAKDGIRKAENVDERIAHEFADCLWSILVLAKKYDVDIEKSFIKTMDELEIRIVNDIHK
jgi:NTP pyrophosphatase (non-canonical NTP hydrolase)